MDEDKKVVSELHDAVLSEEGVISEKFDGPLRIDQTVNGEIDEDEGIPLVYSFTPDEIKEALILFQKKTIYKKNMLFTLVLGLLFLIYLVQIITDGSSSFNSIICMISICTIGLIWYFPWQHIRQVIKAMRLEEEQIEYHITIYPNAIKVGRGETASTIFYEDKQLECWETDGMIVIGYAKQRLFALPKRCFPNEVEQVLQYLKRIMS